MTDTATRPGTDAPTRKREAGSGTADDHEHGEQRGRHEDRGHQDLPAPEERGRTTIADSVVEKMAGMATREVAGVHNLGTGMARTLGGVRERMPGGQPSVTRGVRVEVGEHQAAVDLDVVVDYGYPIADVAAEIRVSVVSALERMTGLEVVEVNVAVDDIDIPDDDDGQAGEQDRDQGFGRDGSRPAEGRRQRVV